ncbi:cellobiose phosphorylase [Paenibacillus sp. IB182496]|uniref:Cellobiose phosphorylase n=1 Tax=Paenibacillus sabuli TaxID=2772509 RepID=A0A927BVP3_9BACL|nr:amylo-alpha-1,6-glucosidase [Paenibacillus sabuli]MBD2846605.1 cellobiose phosphorylase [Paenibacillus sabuli]
MPAKHESILPIAKAQAEHQFCLEAGEVRFTFWNSGELYEAAHRRAGTMINQWHGNPIDGALSNLYLRVLRGPRVLRVAPLLGPQSASALTHRSATRVVWEGRLEEIAYRVVFALAEGGTWFWRVMVDGRAAEMSDAHAAALEVDVVYGQDVGLAAKGAVRSNEAYVSQYIDHAVFRSPERGYVVCSRQNQPQQGGRFPYLQQGAITGAAGYSTDGFQFYGLSYKETNRPEALWQAELPSTVYQYEFAYTGLQSGRAAQSGIAEFVFYGMFAEDHPDAVTALEYEEELRRAWAQVQEQDAEAEGGRSGESKIAARPEPAAAPHSASEAALSGAPAAGRRAPTLGEPLQTAELTPAEIERLYPSRSQEEWAEGRLLSFFTDTYEHVVLKAKERLVERPHGHIVMSGGNDRLGVPVLASTSYMYGIFNAQLVVGNTTYNKLLTNARNALNVMKTSGQRIYVEIGGVYRLLAMPSLYEIGFNYARWHYRTADETFIVTSFTATDAPHLQLELKTESGKPYRYLVTQQIAMDANEYEAPPQVKLEGRTLELRAGEAAPSAKAYPALCYRLHVEGAELTLTDERALRADAAPGSAALVALALGPTAAWTMVVQGLLDGGAGPVPDPGPTSGPAAQPGPARREAAAEAARYREFLRGVMNGFRLTQGGACDAELERLNALAWWYTHNMLVHYSTPHGLEQYGGAAWGTRDVCQGPTEYFLATHKFETVREILRTVYAHQYEDDGNWPQWFMFDAYAGIQAGESHGDVIVWPLKALADYLAATGDEAVLEDRVPYMDRAANAFTAEPVSIYAHVRKQLAYIREHFLPGTHLSAYGDGDWDDTLQPADPRMKQYMTSSWTVALTYQTLRRLAAALARSRPDDAAELERLADGIEADFRRYMLDTPVIPGFVYMERPGEAERMLHPSDTRTGIRYRLLPMTRSMIGELLTPEQAEAHYNLILDELDYPDGVRLMDRPADYAGGVSRHFKRAEQGANVGREIGLQYVHAHIRFVEAMAKLGKSEEAWHGLARINPVGLTEAVPNAELRQRNAYFSSSDGKFATRYEAQAHFERLRDGSVPVKGGWRIYSSGPGIYMNQLIANCLGIRVERGGLRLDPVLPARLDGLELAFAWRGRPVTFVYRLGSRAEGRVMLNGRELPAVACSNRYRRAGWRIEGDVLERELDADGNTIEIYVEEGGE